MSSPYHQLQVRLGIHSCLCPRHPAYWHLAVKYLCMCETHLIDEAVEAGRRGRTLLKLTQLGATWRPKVWSRVSRPQSPSRYPVQNDWCVLWRRTGLFHGLGFSVHDVRVLVVLQQREPHWWRSETQLLSLPSPRKLFPDLHFKWYTVYLLLNFSCLFALPCHRLRKGFLSDNKLFIPLIDIIGC